MTDKLLPHGWPFWAPTEARSVTRALRLAKLRPGERFLDIGCGDGRVLVAAARAGAQVVGIESDVELVEVARQHLADEGCDGTVIHGDAQDPGLDLDADVVFTYLSPAMLQRLRPRLQRSRPGSRLVTIDFAVPGLVAQRVVSGVHVYQLPAATAPAKGRPGWPSQGTLVAALPGYESLTALEAVHPGGPVIARWTRDLDDAASFYLGTTHAEPGASVALDIRWHELDAGTIVAGAVDVPGVGVHHVVAFVTDGDNGMWELSDVGVHNITMRLARDPAPASFAELLAAAEGPT